jgi:hypothetical protein
VIIFNFVGLGMLAACFGFAFGVGWLFGITDEAPLMLIAGPLVFFCDLLYRGKHAQNEGWWYRPRSGGQLFFVPLWAFGIIWMILGTFRLSGA